MHRLVMNFLFSKIEFPMAKIELTSMKDANNIFSRRKESVICYSEFMLTEMLR